MIVQRLEKLRKLMKEREIDVYVIPTSDFHETEYVGSYFKAREYMSNFTGSAGTLIVSMDEAVLYTDGRYFIQAEKELYQTTIQLMKMGEKDTMDMMTYIQTHVKEGRKVGFDGRVVPYAFAKKIQQAIAQKQATLYVKEDLVNEIWKERPMLQSHPIYLLDTQYSGCSIDQKLTKLRDTLKQKELDAIIITTLDDIAWLLNIRGNDIENYPVVLSYLVVSQESAYLYVDSNKVNKEVQTYFKQANIIQKEYDEIYQDVVNFSYQQVAFDAEKVNYRIISSLPKQIQLHSMSNPTQLWKAQKNEVELNNVTIAHKKDGLAMLEFMYWLKRGCNLEEESEYSASEYLASCRKKQEHFISASFHTISAYQENAAMMHYRATKEQAKTLKKEGLLLVDSGGQYLEGTTDITRTFALGNVSDVMKEHYTKVLKGLIKLSDVQFLYGCTGQNLDILARGTLWKDGIDYRCGTGHGIGYLLNVHEGPNGFRWKKVVERNDSGVFEEGMITTIEPGVYREGMYGIRIENEVICRKSIENEYGQFMKFETTTFCPIDKDAIDTKYLSTEEIAWLNAYHQSVYDMLSPAIRDEDLLAFLKEYTSPIV